MEHIIIDAVRNAVLITGLVVVMMMMIESMNIESKGLIFKGLKRTKFGQVVVASLLGSIPGCMGGFATVSLYTHRMFSFGALVAMMIASSGDEAFVMLAMIPDQALILFAILFVLAIIIGVVTDIIHDRIHARHCDKQEHTDCGAETDCVEGYVIHSNSCSCHHDHSSHNGSTHDHSAHGCSVHDHSEQVHSAHGCSVHDHSEQVHSAHRCSAHDHGTGYDEGCNNDHVNQPGNYVSATPEQTISSKAKRHYGWKRIMMFAGLAIFIGALATGRLGHDHGAHTSHHDHSAHAVHDHVGTSVHDHECTGNHDHVCTSVHDHECTGDHDHERGLSINLLSEDWMNVLFAGLSVIVLFVLLFASDHFVEEHLWNHIVKKHLPTIFAWTLGVLLLIGVGLQFVDINRWISDNTALMILLATLIGIIPESGPHMIFVTLYATGVVPFPVLLASSISQDGHACLPLLAESKRSFVWAKLINCVVALAIGFAAMLFLS